jgi:U3 small nucleolar RNA-associated protein 7
MLQHFADNVIMKVYSPPTIHSSPPGFTPDPKPTRSIPPPPLYLTHPIPHRPLLTPRFCPYTDILTIPHASGLSSILVPGAGIANFDSHEADPFESGKERREREVKRLLEKVEGTMVGVGEDSIGGLVDKEKMDSDGIGEGGDAMAPFARLKRWERLKVSGKADETEVEGADAGLNETDGGGENDEEKRKEDKEKREKRKMRGKGKSLKRYVVFVALVLVRPLTLVPSSFRYLRKQRKNVIDPRAVSPDTTLLNVSSHNVLVSFRTSGRYPG